jgi:hypothetical protein
VVQVYNYAQRPKGKTREQVDIAVDSLARISIGAQYTADSQPKAHLQYFLYSGNSGVQPIFPAWLWYGG